MTVATRTVPPPLATFDTDRGIAEGRRRPWGRYLGLGLLMLGMVSRVVGDPVSGELFSLRQPDGTQVEVRIWGDEFYRVVESLDGYTLVRDPQTGAGCYARLSPDGNELISTGVPVRPTLPAGLDLARHLRINPASARAKIAAARARHAAQRDEVLATLRGAAADRDPPDSGDVEGIVLLVDFADDPATILTSEIDNYCNQIGYSGYGNNGSVRDYFYDVSEGHLTYTNFVPTAYYRASQLKTWYENPNYYRARTLVLEALNALDDSGFDFSQYDSNNDGTIDAINCFYAGPCRNAWAEGLWPHCGWISFCADGVCTARYQITDIGNSLELRTFCHENGHMIGYWPDLYDYGGESTGVGDFCLMGYGAANTNPAEPCAYMKYIAGWADMTILTTPQSGLVAPAGVNTVYKYEHPTLSNEYYMIENRQQSDRDADIPDAGLAIWHIDTHGSNDYEQGTPQYHYLVTLVQADGDWDLEHGSNVGDSTDLWGAPDYRECTPYTDPNTDWWDGSGSDLFIRDIGPSASTIRFTFGPTTVHPPGPEAGSPGCGVAADCVGAWEGADCVGGRCYVAKNRYLSFDPTTNASPVAYQVELVEAVDYPGAIGRTWWVDEPVCYDYPNGSPVLPPPATCEGADRFGWVSELASAAVTRSWTEEPLHIADCAVAPGGTYEIRATNDVGETFTEPLVINTVHKPTGPSQSWGDITGGPVEGMPGWWLPPDRTTNFADVANATRTFENRVEDTGFPPRVWVDVEINQVINLADVQFIVAAFEGKAYSEIDLPLIGVNPADCP